VTHYVSYQRLVDTALAVRFHAHVVRRIQALAVVTVLDDGDGPVVLGADHAAAAVQTRHQPSLAIARVAVREVRRLAEDAGRARLFVPSHDAVVRDVAPEEAPDVAQPHGALGPSETGREPLDLREVQLVAREALV